MTFTDYIQTLSQTQLSKYLNVFYMQSEKCVLSAEEQEKHKLLLDEQIRRDPSRRDV